ncbi:segregation/condensation protein A [Rickettsiales bacterium]|nr:segregation/condensation protein A [Rickettsiales bacterium]
MNQGHSIQNSTSSNKLNVNISGYEGPLDLLLDLSKKQKVDITKVSIQELAEQYLNFIRENLNDINLSADYLVMASFLAYLKSKMLLPNEDNDNSTEISEEELTRRLVQYDAIKKACQKLLELPQEDKDFYTKRIKNEFIITNKIVVNTSLNDLIKSYFFLYKKNNQVIYDIKKDDYYSIEDGIKWLKTFFSKEVDENNWKNILEFLPTNIDDFRIRKSAVISILLASLNMVKDGSLVMTQKKNFDKIFIKNCGRKNGF